uniref:Uncharacterized protein n=1 Tax=Pristionchus pacificus TaxID=54126 RepID=A0A2A6BXS1_PRIPA|eukprot:PDM70561.1 hypothetical protein PRIPAC_46807 [Pristionchus pacificus]
MGATVTRLHIVLLDDIERDVPEERRLSNRRTQAHHRLIPPTHIINSRVSFSHSSTTTSAMRNGFMAWNELEIAAASVLEPDDRLLHHPWFQRARIRHLHRFDHYLASPQGSLNAKMFLKRGLSDREEKNLRRDLENEMTVGDRDIVRCIRDCNLFMNDDVKREEAATGCFRKGRTRRTKPSDS